VAMFITTGRPRIGVGGDRVSRVLGRVSTAVVTVVSAVLIAANSHGPFGQLVTVAFVVLTPAFAISGLLPDMDGFVIAIVAAAGAIAINALVAQTMLALNAWSPFAGVVAVGVISSALWILQAAVVNRSVTKEG
jgi:hypothetical protein